MDHYTIIAHDLLISLKKHDKAVQSLKVLDSTIATLERRLTTTSSTTHAATLHCRLLTLTGISAMFKRYVTAKWAHVQQLAGNVVNNGDDDDSDDDNDYSDDYDDSDDYVDDILNDNSLVDNVEPVTNEHFVNPMIVDDMNTESDDDASLNDNDDLIDGVNDNDDEFFCDDLLSGLCICDRNM